MARFQSERRRWSPTRSVTLAVAAAGGEDVKLTPLGETVLRVDRSEAAFTTTVFGIEPARADAGSNLAALFGNANLDDDDDDDDDDDESDDGRGGAAAAFMFCSMAAPERPAQQLEYALLVPTNPPRPPPVVAFVNGVEPDARGVAAAAAVPARLLDAVRRGDCAVAVLTHRSAAEAPWPAPYDDLRSQLDAVRVVAAARGCDPDALAIFGVGSGGFCAAMLASRGAGEGLPVAAAVTVGGAASLADIAEDRGEVFGSRYWWEPTQADCAESRLMGFDCSDPANVYRLGNATPTNYLRSAAPTFVAHGENDTDVPVAQALRYYHDLRDAGVAAELCIVPGGRDTSIDLDDMPVAQALSFLRAHLGANC